MNTPEAAAPEIAFLQNLRSKTAIAHKNLESLPVSSSLLRPVVSKDDYIHYLELMYDVVAGLEKSILPSLSPIIPDAHMLLKSALIENDLAFVGAKKPSYKNPFGDTAELTVPQKLGIAYVVEGSTLGGRFILKNIESVLGFNEHGGATYFYGYGNKTGSSWKNFLDGLTTYALYNSNTDEIIEGAIFGFEKIYQHLNCLPEL